MPLSDMPAIMLPNKYGFKVNISHPKIRILYERYKKTASKAAYGLSDKQRLDFEEKTIEFYSRLYKKAYNEIYTYPGLPYQREQLNGLINITDIPE